MKFVSWNVNGIRSAIKKGFAESVAQMDADVLCLQEVRALPEQVELPDLGYTVHWNPAEKKGYSGTAILTRTEPLDVHRGFFTTRAFEDTEGRLITLEFEDYYLITVYTPNSQDMLARLDYRTNQWDPTFLTLVTKLRRKKAVIFCGDLNVAHMPIDLAKPDENERTAGFTVEERDNFDRIIKAGFVDTFREFNTDGENYTYWSYMRRAREHNEGWRIDYFCISEQLRPRLSSAAILSDITGSDHCPVAITID